MGFLTSILGYPNYPPLDPGTAAAARLEAQRRPLEQLVTNVKARLELLPASDAIYVFVGKPPETFGFAWLTDGAEHNLKTLIEQRRFTGMSRRLLNLGERGGSGAQHTAVAAVGRIAESRR